MYAVTDKFPRDQFDGNKLSMIRRTSASNEQWRPYEPIELQPYCCLTRNYFF